MYLRCLLENSITVENKKIKQLGSWCTDEQEISLLYNSQKLKYCSAKRYMASSMLKNLNIPVIEIDVTVNLRAFFYKKIEGNKDKKENNDVYIRLIMSEILNKYGGIVINIIKNITKILGFIFKNIPESIKFLYYYFINNF